MTTTTRNGPRVRAAAKARRRSQANESQLVTAILRALSLKGFFSWRVNSSLQVIGEKSSHARRVIKGAPAGSPDIMLVIPRDVLLPRQGDVAFDAITVAMLCGLEVKTATGKQSDSQKDWEERAKLKGIRYRVVRSITEALEAVHQWCRGQQ